ncbi:hypothetical protein ACNY67_18750 [Pantoea sp. KXB45]|uniref:HofO family protein n=1 Tax=Pantoea sp. KXB45 TaxID=3402309 RepID=UPI003AB1B9DF
MMSEWWDRWWQMTALPRYGLLAIVSAGLLLLFGVALLRPRQQALIVEQQMLSQLTHTLQQRQQQWQQHPASAQLKAQLQALQRARPDSDGAMDAILAARHHQLEAWQPDTASRTLTLHLQWPAFLSLFAELAEGDAPFPHHFQLRSQPPFLVAQLWLEPDDAL